MNIQWSKILIASNNLNKIAEFQKMLKNITGDIVSYSDLQINSPDENGSNFEQNAEIKALHGFNTAKIPTIADDSGLEILALNNIPGIQSARSAEKYGGYNNFFKIIKQKLDEKKAFSIQSRTARFVCSICLVLNHNNIIKVEGRCNGHITWPPRGTYGFGYDPIFIPYGHSLTFAEMNNDDKNGTEENPISHRAIAYKLLLDKIRQNDKH